MKTPSFWRKPHMLLTLLIPVGWVYYELNRLNRWQQKRRSTASKLSRPIICIGNAIAGGAGKTPATKMLASMLKIAGQEPHCISRGYGGKAQLKPIRVDVMQHNAAHVGDEPLLLAQTCPTWVCSNRQEAAMAAIDAGASVILADDGLQSPSFHKDIALLVVDKEFGIGNGHLIPAGPLREPLSVAYKRMDAAILIGDGNFKLRTKKPVFRADIVPVTDLTPFIKQKVIAFAGIAQPEKFFFTLHNAGINPIEELAFADHQNYSPTQLALLTDKAEEQGAILMTTAKDYVKMPKSFRDDCIVVNVKLQLEKPEEFLQWLEEKLAHG